MRRPLFLAAALGAALALPGRFGPGPDEAMPRRRAQATAPFPTLPATAPVPTLPPSVPTPSENTPTPTITLTPSPRPTTTATSTPLATATQATEVHLAFLPRARNGMRRGEPSR